MDNRTQELIEQTTDLIEQAMQAGRDEMAQVLADWLAEQREVAGDDETSGHYLDGIEDALITLVQAGATDPRDDEQGKEVRS